MARRLVASEDLPRSRRGKGGLYEDLVAMLREEAARSPGVWVDMTGDGDGFYAWLKGRPRKKKQPTKWTREQLHGVESVRRGLDIFARYVGRKEGVGRD